MDLTSGQIQAIREGEPILVVPPEIGAECVLVRKDVYDNISSLVNDSAPTDEEVASIGWEVGKKIGWDTPEMAEYDEYDAHKQ